MRTLMLAALLGTGLFAQAPVDPADPAAQWKRTRQEIQLLLPPVRSAPRLVLPKTSTAVTPSDSSQRVTLAPGQACAIPLLNAMPTSGRSGDAKMAIPLVSGGDRMPIVQPPAPSCADVRR